MGARSARTLPHEAGNAYLSNKLGRSDRARPSAALETILTKPSLAILKTLAVLAMSGPWHPLPAQSLDGPPAGLKATAAGLYAAYGTAIATPRRDAIAGYYHRDGAIRVFNGATRRLSRAALDSIYQGARSPPAFFAWDGLRFDSIGPGQVVVTGGFRWQGGGQRDTIPYLYAALLVAVDSGMAIVFEHETLRPPR